MWWFSGKTSHHWGSHPFRFRRFNSPNPSVFVLGDCDFSETHRGWIGAWGKRRPQFFLWQTHVCVMRFLLGCPPIMSFKITHPHNSMIIPSNLSMTVLIAHVHSRKGGGNSRGFLPIYEQARNMVRKVCEISHGNWKRTSFQPIFKVMERCNVPRFGGSARNRTLILTIFLETYPVLMIVMI